jgi:hypothetical protein
VASNDYIALYDSDVSLAPDEARLNPDDLDRNRVGDNTASTSRQVRAENYETI